VGEPGGGTYRPHTFLFDGFVPALRARGVGDDEIRRLLVDNPARAFSPTRREAPRASL
jgi:phosphotriesterase-related protein